jgi:hypothetical protein
MCAIYVLIQKQVRDAPRFDSVRSTEGDLGTHPLSTYKNSNGQLIRDVKHHGENRMQSIIESSFVQICDEKSVGKGHNQAEAGAGGATARDH